MQPSDQRLPRSGGCLHAVDQSSHTPAPCRRRRVRDRADPRGQHLGRHRAPRSGYHDRRSDPRGPLRRPPRLSDQRWPGRPDVRGPAHARRLLPLHRHRPCPHPDDRLLRRTRLRDRARPIPRVLPADPGLVPDQFLRPSRLPPRGPDHRLAAHAEVLPGLRHRARRPLRPGLPPVDPGHRDHRRSQGGLPVLRLPERAGDPERRSLRPRHGPVGELRRQPRRPGRRRRPGRQRLLRVLPPGRRLRLLRADRLPGPAPRERPCLRPARPLHPGRAGARSATGTS
ncbi:hypothetical protein QFZ32_005329 [Streptomyces canus]|nr:hypothetical protein [Streptomyces canus]